MTLDEAITDLEGCLANDWPGEWLNVEALELVLEGLKQARAEIDRLARLVSKRDTHVVIMRANIKTLAVQIAAKDAALREAHDHMVSHGDAYDADVIFAIDKALAAPARGTDVDDR